MGGPSLSHDCGWQLKLVKLPWLLNWRSGGAALPECSRTAERLSGKLGIRFQEQLHERAQVSAADRNAFGV